MKKIPLTALVLSLAFGPVSPLFAGGKSADKHVQARAAKAAADKAVEDKAAERSARIKAGESPAAIKAEEEEKARNGWVWEHRPVRHKQTMPAAPKLGDAEKNK